MNIFRYFRDRNRRAAQFIGFPAVVSEPCELNLEYVDDRIVPLNPAVRPRIFEQTHMHIGTGGLYMLTSIGERLEVTGDDAYPLAEYENAEGEQFAQRADRFLDGRFRELPL